MKLTNIQKIVVIISVSVSIAMYCLVQLYIVVAAELASYKPLLKLFSIKAVGKFCDVDVDDPTN